MVDKGTGDYPGDILEGIERAVLTRIREGSDRIEGFVALFVDLDEGECQALRQHEVDRIKERFPNPDSIVPGAAEEAWANCNITFIKKDGVLYLVAVKKK